MKKKELIKENEKLKGAIIHFLSYTQDHDWGDLVAYRHVLKDMSGLKEEED